MPFGCLLGEMFRHIRLRKPGLDPGCAGGITSPIWHVNILQSSAPTPPKSWRKWLGVAWSEIVAPVNPTADGDETESTVVVKQFNKSKGDLHIQYTKAKKKSTLYYLI